jgi:act minimal PKS acyl carrier protein
MNEPITLDDLRVILAQCAGTDESANLDGDILDVAFTELGYDSLALMEAASVIQRKFGIEIPDDELFDIESPRALLDRANRSVADVA